MALYSTLNDLKTDIRRETERKNNAKFDEALPRMIASAEHRMYLGADEPIRSDPLRLRIMEETTTLTLASGAVALPTGYLATLRLSWDGSPQSYPDYESPQSFFENRYTNTSGSPVKYTIEGSTLYVSPLISGSLGFAYYKQPTALVDDTDTNTVLTTYPMLYFHAVLIEAYSYLRNPTEMQKQFGAYVSLAGGLSKTEARARRGSSPMAPRISGWRI